MRKSNGPAPIIHHGPIYPMKKPLIWSQRQRKTLTKCPSTLEELACEWLTDASCKSNQLSLNHLFHLVTGRLESLVDKIFDYFGCNYVEKEIAIVRLDKR
jgi:hypothetical protein